MSDLSKVEDLLQELVNKTERLCEIESDGLSADSLYSKLEKIENYLSSIDSRLETVEGQLDTLDASICNLES